MIKQKISYETPLDAIVALAKRLSNYEKKHKLSSEEFFDRYSKGMLENDIDFIEWSNDYSHFVALKLDLEARLSHAA